MPLTDFLGVKQPLVPGAEDAPNPDALRALLMNGSMNTLQADAPTSEAPDLTGYFSQLNTSRNPMHVQGVDQTAAAEQKLEDESRQAQVEENDPNIKAARDAEQKDKLALQGESARVTGEYGLKNEAMKAASQQQVATTNANAKTQVAQTAARLAGSKLPNQVQVQAYNAAHTVDSMNDLEEELKDPELEQFIGPIMGRLTATDDGHVTSDLVAESLASDPRLQYKLGHLQSSILATAIKTAQGYNQRGATKELVDQMKSSIRSSRPLPNLLGTIDAHKDLLMKMANPSTDIPGTNPFGKPVSTDPFGSQIGAKPGYAGTDPNKVP